MNDDGITEGIERLRGVRILYVEDEDDIGELTAALLDMHGCRTRWVRSADEALMEPIQDYDLLLSDVQMPGSMDGIELARRIARQRPDLPILLASGYIAGSERLQQLDIEVIAKPYPFSTLCKAMLRYIA